MIKALPLLAVVIAAGSLGCKKDAEPAPASSAQPAKSSSPNAAAASAAPAADADPLVGKPAPDFTVTTYDGKSLHLAALKGKPVVVYFYPKDETPGCTKEACSFKDAWEALAKTNVVLVGVSLDNEESHKKFVEHWKLPFNLVSNPKGDLAKLFGVPMQEHQGQSYISRQTIVIGADGNVKKVYRKVNVEEHTKQILSDLLLVSLRVLVDGVALPEAEARAFWGRFSAYLDAHKGNLAGFAQAEGFASVHPETHGGEPVLVVSRTAPQRTYANAPRRPDPPLNETGGSSAPQHGGRRGGQPQKSRGKRS